jgi:hypothetical protein
MKKILLVSFILTLAISAFAYAPRSFYTQLQITDGNIMEYVDTPATPTAPDHDSDFSVTVTDVLTGDLMSTDTTITNFIRVCTAGGPDGDVAWLFFDAQGFPTAGNVPEGREFHIVLTYLGNPDPETNTIERTQYAPTGSAAVWLYGDDSWFLPQTMFLGDTPVTHTISGNFTSTTWETSGVTIETTNPDDVTIQVEGSTYTVTVPEGWTGNIVPSKEGYYFDPEIREYTNVSADIDAQNYVVMAMVDPNAPAITYPEADQVITMEAPGTVTITWTDPDGFMPEYYEVKWMEGDWTNVLDANEWDTPELAEGNHTFAVRGVIDAPQAKIYSRVNINDRNLRSAAPASPKGAGLEASVSFSVVITPAADIPEDTPTPVGDATVTISGGSANYDMSGDIPPIPNGSIVIADQFVLQLIGAGPWTITIQTTAPWASYYSGGMWHAVENSGGFITFTVTASKDMDLPVVLADLDPTLPVELSAFNAVLTAQYFVKLTWISESETGLLGYRVYRSEDNVYDNAVSITPIMIDATNTSSTHVYTHEDREVMNNTGYYYWLEAVDMTHSTPYGPQYVEVKHDETPELPAQTVLKSAYPNPFKANSNTNIPVEVKAGESGTVTIYNVLGQVVKTFNVNEGFNPLTWNGRDSRNNACGSGIYFYKLSTPSKNQTKKMVIVK